MTGFIFYLLLFISTSVIAFQDFKDRLVSLWVLVVYTIAIGAFTCLTVGWLALLEHGIGVLAYFGICFSVLYVYYFIKEKKVPAIIDSKIGKADLVVFLAIGISLPLFQLILFFTVGFSLAALIAIVLLKDKRTVPLAGILAVIYFVFAVLRDFL